MKPFLIDVLFALGWAFVGALIMAMAFGILLKIFNWFTPINEWEEIRKGNTAVAIILAAAILSLAIVVSVAILPAGS